MGEKYSYEIIERNLEEIRLNVENGVKESGRDPGSV